LDASPSYNESKLLSLVAEGNEAAFTILFKRYAPFLEQSIQKIIPDNFDCAEILQETFIRIWLNREKLGDLQHARAYFTKISVNLCFDYLSKTARLARKHLNAALPDTDQETPEVTLSYKETETLVQTAINELPQQRRKIYDLYRKEGLNSRQISEILNISPDYVRQAIGAARDHIREKLIRAGKVLSAISSIF
jgi:RNA polymerase sigma-70 factor (ECF subfamily)